MIDMKEFLNLGRERRKILRRLREIDRDLPALILEANGDGISFDDIGNTFGFTRQRAHQLASIAKVGRDL